MSDVARVELGAADYASNTYLSGQPTVLLGVFQRPGSNALAAAQAVEAEMKEASKTFPPGLEYKVIYNPTEIISQSIKAVGEILLEAIFLVVLVVIVFLQRWRAAIIPVVAIPVSLIGTANRSAARARFDGSRADERAALATFDDTVLQALQETEAALSNYRLTLVRRDALRSASDEAAKATTITQARQREGDISSLELLDAERTSAESQAAVAEADARIAQAQVGLFRALGGNWAS